MTDQTERCENCTCITNTALKSIKDVTPGLKKCIIRGYIDDIPEATAEHLVRIFSIHSLQSIQTNPKKPCQIGVDGTSFGNRADD